VAFAAIVVTATVWAGVSFSLWLQAGVPPGAAVPPPAPRPAGPVEIAGEVLPPPRGSVYWGEYRLGIADDRRVVPRLGQLAGSTPAIAMYFQVWHGQPMFDVEDARWLASQRVVPMVSWESWRPQYEGFARTDQPAYRLDRIASGAFDDFLVRYAQRVREYGGPIFLRPFHEMDGNWYPWAGTVNGNSPDDFVAAWRHVHDLFEEAGAANVTWVWSVNHISADVPGNDVHRYWPGPAFVDWIGISGFNWGPSRDLEVPAVGRPLHTGEPDWVSLWDDFETVYGQRYAELLRYRKPIILTEISSVEEGGDKAAWIQDAVDSLLENFPRIGGFIWYDRVLEPRDWRIDSTLASLVAFRAAVDRPEVLGAPYAVASAEAADEDQVRDRAGSTSSTNQRP
jgi:mannan endo-1,4-beta-mannosidase